MFGAQAGPLSLRSGMNPTSAAKSASGIQGRVETLSWLPLAYPHGELEEPDFPPLLAARTEAERLGTHITFEHHGEGSLGGLPSLPAERVHTCPGPLDSPCVTSRG